MSKCTIEAIIMDWAGTTVDFGSLAPIRGFQSLFAASGIEISEAEARGPMGTEKREHIRQLCQLPRINQCWQTLQGTEPTAADVDRLYQDFIPIQIAEIARSATLIPGVLDTVAWAREQNIAIGANTGYARDMVAGLLQSAAEQGYQPDSVVCASEVRHGRPYPDMSLTNAMALGVKRLAACVKIDDTLPGIEEGLNAGMWTIALTVSGNEVGLSHDDWNALDKPAQQQLRQKAQQHFAGSGAHYVVDSMAEVVPCLIDIQRRLAQGETP